MVLDARTHPLHALAEARQSAYLVTVPALVLAVDDGDPALATVGADDILVPPFLERTALRRVRTLVELGRTRMALWFAEPALEHSVSGLTIGDRSVPDTPIVHATSAFEKITGIGSRKCGDTTAAFFTDPEPTHGRGRRYATPFASSRALR